MKILEIFEGVGCITKQNQTVDVGPNQVSIEAAKFGFKVDKDGRPAHTARGSSVHKLFNLGLAESVLVKLERDKRNDIYVLHMVDNEDKHRVELRGEKGYETGNYNQHDRLHQVLDGLGKAVDLGALFAGETVSINPHHPDGEQALNITKAVMSGPPKNLLDVKTLSPNRLAQLHNVPVKQIQSELEKGIQHELEHTTNPDIAKEIALDHLKERPDYYTQLDRLESVHEQKGPCTVTGEAVCKCNKKINEQEQPRLPWIVRQLQKGINRREIARQFGIMLAKSIRHQGKSQEQLDRMAHAAVQYYADRIDKYAPDWKPTYTPRDELVPSGYFYDEAEGMLKPLDDYFIEKAPPGREKQVKALKKKFDDPGAPYRIAWAQHKKHGKP